MRVLGRSRLALWMLASASLSVGVAACGGANTASTHTQPAKHVSSNARATESPPSTGGAKASAATDFTRVDADKDSDVHAVNDESNNNTILSFGHEAGPSDRRAILALVKRYYAAARAGDGARACSLLYSTMAESAPEDYGLIPGPIYLRGAKTCTEVMTRLFSHFHTRLAVQVPRLKVTHVLLNGRHSLILLSFAKMADREIQATREGHVWKMVALLDSELP